MSRKRHIYLEERFFLLDSYIYIANLLPGSGYICQFLLEEVGRTSVPVTILGVAVSLNIFTNNINVYIYVTL
ncbi:hypothetical protein BGX38DRAFT_1177071 [Terfezia claveryi]|nr:hypothetical protein BGX38DRAFT_1177071 [Terfezia claveryi]